jgi:RimJ/RimL family protein N-acetyltransferase
MTLAPISGPPAQIDPAPPVSVRFATAADAQLLQRWRSEPAVRRHQPLGETTLEQVRAELVAQRPAHLRQGSGAKFQWIVMAGPDAAGWLTLVIHNWEHALAEIGYALSTPFQRRGLMPVALGQLLDEIFLSTRLIRIEARCAVDNRASHRVLERCGFQLEGRLRAYCIVDGQRVDNLLFALLRDDHLRQLGGRPQST